MVSIHEGEKGGNSGMVEVLLCLYDDSGQLPCVSQPPEVQW